MDFEKIYTDGSYQNCNPQWDSEDAVWKGQLITALLQKNKVQFNTMAEVGCGAGSVLATAAATFANARFTGYDIAPQAIALAQKKYAALKNINFITGNFNALQTVSADVLIMADVVEHVTDYYTFLHQLNKKSQTFVFHIPLDISCRSILKPHILLQQRKAVGHIHYFTEEQVWWMLADCGYTIKDWHYTKPAIDLGKPHSVKQAVKKILRAVSFSISKKLSVKLWGGYSLLILANRK